WFLIATSVGFIDYITGLKVQFPIWFIIPVGLASWYNGRGHGYFYAISLSLARFSFHFFWSEQLTTTDAAINAVLRLFTLLLIAYLIDRLAEQTRAMKKELRVLRGIVPICSGCKKIRNDAGEYEPLEKYISERSEAEFSHGLCNDCMHKLYPEYASRVTKEDKSRS
ncbi:MAG: hypothetical protein JSV21_03610, partial [Nitrospirota bacterium]